MAQEIVWSVDQVQCKTEAFGQKNVVQTVSLMLRFFSEDGAFPKNLLVQLGETPTGNFVPFEDLTEVEVVALVKNSLGSEKVTELEAELQAEAISHLTQPLVWLDLNRS